MKKLSIKHIKEQFTKENYILLSDKYEGAHLKLNCICSNGHKCNIANKNCKWHKVWYKAIIYRRYKI